MATTWYLHLESGISKHRWGTVWSVGVEPLDCKKLLARTVSSQIISRTNINGS